MQHVARPARQAMQRGRLRSPVAIPIEFVTIAVSDGISMGHEGMRASLVCREVICDSIETVMHAERFDAMVTFAGCDKSLARDADGGGEASTFLLSSCTEVRSFLAATATRRSTS